MISAVLFDLDGLLIDSERIFYQLVLDLIRPSGGDMSLEEYTTFHAGRTLLDNVTSYIRQFHLPMTPEEGVRITLAGERARASQGARLMPGALPLLTYLRTEGIRSVLATSSTRERASFLLDANGIASFFDDLVCGPDVQHPKPAPDIYLRAAEVAGAAPENCLALEDSENGIRAAHAARIPVICIPDLKNPDKECRAMSAAVLSSLDQVIPYIRARNI